MSRLLGSVIVLFLGFFVFTTHSHAQSRITNSVPETIQQPTIAIPQSYQPQLASGVTPNLGVLTQGILIETLAALSCQLAGLDPLDPYGRCIGVDPSTRQLTRTSSSDGGAISFVARGISGTYSIPVSSSQYIADLRGNFGITKSAYAQQLEQSYGFRSLYPILEIWRGFRNLVFLFFVLIFSAIGIGIMFRLHVDARAVMTVQNQIPKLVIGLILISFSYAIAGLMIDFMYALIFLLFNVAAQMYESIGIDPVKFPGLNSNTIGFVNTLYSPHDGFSDLAEFSFVGRAITGVMNSGIMSVTMGASLSVGEIVTNIFDGILDSTIGSLFGLLMSPMSIALTPISAACNFIDSWPNLANIPGAGWIEKIPIVGSIPLIGGGPECGAADIIKDLPKLIVRSLTSLIAFLVILIAILFSLFRLWFILIKAYIFILLDIVFAPFWIAAGLLPKGGLGWWAWFRSVMANLSVFPVTIGVLLMGKIFMDTFGKGGSDHFVPPLIGDVGDPSEIGMLIGLGMILLTPQLVDQVKGVLKTKSPSLNAVSGAIGLGRGVAGKPFKEIKHEFFGKDAFNNPRMGTQWIGNRLGRVAAGLTGGSWEKHKYAENKDRGLWERTKNVANLSKDSRTRPELKSIHQLEEEEKQKKAQAALNRVDTPAGREDEEGGDGTGGSGGGSSTPPPGGGGTGGSGGGGSTRLGKALGVVGGAVAGPAGYTGGKWVGDKISGRGASTPTTSLDSEAVAVPDATDSPVEHEAGSGPETEPHEETADSEAAEAIRDVGADLGQKLDELKGAAAHTGEVSERGSEHGIETGLKKEIPHMIDGLSDVVAHTEDSNGNGGEKS